MSNLYVINTTVEEIGDLNSEIRNHRREQIAVS